MSRSKIALAAVAAFTVCLAPVMTPASAALSVADRISDMIDQTMAYPRYMYPAVEEGGVVLVAFAVGADGYAHDVRIIEGSGYRMLDQAATRTIARLHGLPAEAVGRHSIAVLQFRVDGGTDGAEALRVVKVSITRLREQLPDALVPTRYMR